MIKKFLAVVKLGAFFCVLLETSRAGRLRQQPPFYCYGAALRLDSLEVDCACANIMFPAGQQVRDAVHCCKISRQYCTRPGLLEREDIASRSELAISGFINVEAREPQQRSGENTD